MKKALIGFGVVLVVLVVGLGALFGPMMIGVRPLVDGAELPDGARTVKDGFVAIFVLPAGDGAVALVDCGDDAKGAAILGELKRRGLGPEAVKAIFLTHGHPDHVAAVSSSRRRMSTRSLGTSRWRRV